MGNCIIARNGGGMETYSTEEQVIGTWIDGKKIYRKLVVTGANSSGIYVVSTGSLKINKILKAEGFFDIVSGTNQAQYQIPFCDSYNNAVITEFMPSIPQIVLRSNYGSSSKSIYNVYLWIEYTKTTD